MEIVKIFWETNKPPDHSPETGAGQRRLLIVGRRRISLLSVLRPLRRPTDGPDPELRMVVGARVQRTVDPSADVFQGSNP
jgi:hypothetical protein